MPELDHGWLSIDLFRPETFPGNEPFLVWLMNEDGKSGWWEAAQYGPDDYAEDGQ
jgi:hypothetical protein